MIDSITALKACRERLGVGGNAGSMPLLRWAAGSGRLPRIQGSPPTSLSCTIHRPAQQHEQCKAIMVEKQLRVVSLALCTPACLSSVHAGTGMQTGS